MGNYYFVILISFIVLSSILICWKAVYIYKISKHPYPKFTSGFALLLLALIAFIFGIHADIFSSYDKLNNKLSQSYDWFDPADIVRFPIEQYQINRRYFPKNEINLDSSVSNRYDRKFTIVIDKTKSTESNSFAKRISQKLKSSLQTELQSSVSQNQLELQSLMVEDLFVLTAMKQLSQNSNSKTILEVIYYLGDGSIQSPYDVDIPLTKNNLCESVQKYLSFYSQKILNAPKGRYTNFNEIIKALTQSNFLGDNQTIFSNLYFLSDFEHEEESGSSFAELNESLHSFNNSKSISVSQINLLKIKGKSNSPDKVNTTLNLFRQNFNHLYFYEFSEEQTYFEENPVQAISSIFSSTKPDSKQQPIYLYYLWNDTLTHSDFQGRLTLNTADFKGSNVILGLRDKVEVNSNANYTGYILLNGLKTKVFPFTSAEFFFENNKSFQVTFNTDSKDNKNYYIELSQPGNTFKVSEPLILREVLPATSCVYLIYLYAFLFITLSSLILYFILCLWHSHEQYYRVKQIVVVVTGILFVVLAALKGWGVLNNYFSLLFHGFNVQFSFLFIISILATIALHSFYFYFSYKKKVSKLTEVTPISNI
jgi:hypothetical protein